MKKLLVLLTFLLLAQSATACFGPKLFVGTPAGVSGELLFHLAAIYIHEKTGVDSIRLELEEGQRPEQLLEQEQVDLVFATKVSGNWKPLLQVGDELVLLTGPRPTDDLQFTTVPRTLAKLQRLLTVADLAGLRRQVVEGMLPAAAVRKLYMERGWI